MAGAKFITFEGGEGAGKSTQIELLAAALARAGISVRTTREPGGSPGAEEIRRLLVTGPPNRWDAMTEALLHFAARRDHLRGVVLPDLEAGHWVLSDRFADSTMAYQGYGHGLGRGAIEALHALVVGDFAPDLTLILDLPVDLGLERALARRDMRVTVVYDAPIPAPLQAGQEVARLVITAPGEEPIEFPLMAGAAVERLGVFGRITTSLEYLVFGAH